MLRSKRFSKILYQSMKISNQAKKRPRAGQVKRPPGHADLQLLIPALKPIVMLQTEMDKSFKIVNLLWTVMKGICYDKAT